MIDRSGQQLGNYRIIRPIGHGGFADVYVGEHIYLQTQVAIKLLQTRLAGDAMEEFLKEARTIAHLVHPHIVRVLDFGVEGGTPFLVMDYARNGTLRQRHPKGTRLPLDTIVAYIKQIAEALQHAHEKKLIHRDIKPENMLLGENDLVLLSDFGIALVAQSTRYQNTQEVIGTVAYMAPEQLQGKPRRASDQYALGIIVYEWLCGNRPFQGSFTEVYSQHLFVPPPSLREKLPDLPSAVEEVVLKALAKDPKDRFSSVREFATALERAYRSEHLPQDVPIIASLERQPLISEVVVSSQSTLPGDTAPGSSISENTSPGRSLQITGSILPTDELSPSPFSTSLPPASRSTQEVKETPLMSGPESMGASTIPRQRLSHRRLFLISAIAALMLVVSSAALFPFVNSNLIAAKHAQATALASTATHAALSAAHATATSRVAPTVTAQAYATATVLALQNIYNSTPTFQDGLVDNTNNWGNIGIANQSSFSGGFLHVIDTGAGGPSYQSVYPQNQNLDFSNFTATIEMKVLKGFGGGMIFRASLDQSRELVKYYYLLVGTDGSYALRISDGNGPDQTLASGSTPVIHTSLNQTNLIGIVANGSIIDLYINGEKIARVSNSIYSHGTIGLFAYDSGHPNNEANPPVEVVFSNLKIWKLS